MKKKKNSALTRAKNKAWRYFSIYIRTRDCLYYSGSPDEGMCVTCKEWFPFNELQAGHFVGGRTNALLYDEEIVHTQCARCNILLKGNYQAYTLFMLTKHTEEEIQELLSRRNITLKLTTEDHLRLALEFKNKTEALLEDYREGKYDPFKTAEIKGNNKPTILGISETEEANVEPAAFRPLALAN